jgi:ABC-2 type transport system permease protein
MNLAATEPALSRGALLHCYALESKLEFLRLLRTPAFALPTLLFPAMFYLLFGVVFARHNPAAVFPLTTWLLATCSVFGVMAPGLFGFGVTVALDREQGWLDLKRALPMPPGAYLGAKLAMAMLFAAIIFLIIAVLALTLGGVRLRWSSWALLFVVDVLGVLPFCAIGLFIGSVTNGQSAPAVANLVYLPMSFLSGLWMPLTLLPALLGDIAPMWPAYHLAQLALGAVGQASVVAAPHVVALAGFTLVFLALARWRLARAG